MICSSGGSRGSGRKALSHGGSPSGTRVGFAGAARLDPDDVPGRFMLPIELEFMRGRFVGVVLPPLFLDGAGDRLVVVRLFDEVVRGVVVLEPVPFRLAGVVD